MTSALPSTTMKHLAFIQALHRQGREQVRQPEPLSAMGVLAYHDAVELFLVLSGEHLQATLPKGIGFVDYWKELARNTQPKPITLTAAKAMDRLNRLRVDLKHHGAIPGPSAIEQASADVNTFFTDNTPLIFGIDYDDINMIGLVTQGTARDKLHAADGHAQAGDYVEALSYLREAFEWLLEDYASRKRIDFNTSAFSFGQDYGFSSNAPTGIRGLDSNLGEFLEKTRDSVQSMQQALRVVAIGLDYRAYIRFSMMAPKVLITGRGDNAPRHVWPVRGLEIAQGDYEFCRSFVISTSLRMAENDFDLDLAELYWHDRRSTATPAEG
ncbi:hypothetical protein ACWEJ6_54700 [Nonomuraea sp. NPDC004702]